MKIIDRIPGAQGPLSKQTVKNQISDKLAYMIHSGLLRAGDELPSERELASSLGVSRETVRAAIASLASHQMVEISQGSRTRVIGHGPTPIHESVSTMANLKRRSLQEVTEARGAVETQVIGLAAQRISQAQLDRLEALLEEQRSMLTDPVRFQISDQQFHQTLYNAGGNAVLADVLFDLYGYALEFRRLALQRKGAIARSVEEHAGIVAALKSRDANMAMVAIQRHLAQVHRTTQAVMPSK